MWAPRDGTLVGIGEGAARVRNRALLFDLEHDPAESHDLRAERPILARFLHRGLVSWLEATDVTGTQPPAPLDPRSRELLESLGYLAP